MAMPIQTYRHRLYLIPTYYKNKNADGYIHTYKQLSYARPQDRLDCAEHHHGRELCSAPLLELAVMTLAENQEGSARTELPLCSI